MTDSTQLPFDIVTLPKAGKFLTVVDALPIGKIKIMLTSYNKDTKAAISSNEAYLDIDRARVMCHILKSPMTEGAKPTVFSRFGGGMSNGDLQSRIIKIDYDTAGGKFGEIPWRFEITVGKGKYTSSGGIEPDDKNPHKEFVRLNTEEALLLALTLEAFFAANAHFIFHQRIELQQEKRQKRFDKRGATSGFSFKQPAYTVIPVAWRGYAAGTPLADLDTDTLKLLSTKTAKTPMLAHEATNILFGRNV